MKTFKCGVRVPGPSGSMMMTVWTSVSATNSFAAKRLLEAQYGFGNVLGVPVQVP
jgi:hypothetical protein